MATRKTTSTILRITETGYNKMIENALLVSRNTADPDVKDDARFLFVNSIPTIDLLEKHRIGPFEECVLNETILQYLVFYAEKYEDKETGEERYIFVPDPSEFDDEEIREFENTRAYIRKTILKRTEMVF